MRLVRRSREVSINVMMKSLRSSPVVSLFIFFRLSVREDLIFSYAVTRSLGSGYFFDKLATRSLIAFFAFGMIYTSIKPSFISCFTRSSSPFFVYSSSVPPVLAYSFLSSFSSSEDHELVDLTSEARVSPLEDHVRSVSMTSFPDAP